MVDDYAGDVSPERAWSVLKEDPRARLVDVRTAAEWNYVGVPDLSTIGRDLGLVEWITFPAGRRNDEFVDQAVMIQRDPDAATFSLPVRRQVHVRGHRHDASRLSTVFQRDRGL